MADVKPANFLIKYNVVNMWFAPILNLANLYLIASSYQYFIFTFLTLTLLVYPSLSSLIKLFINQILIKPMVIKYCWVIDKVHQEFKKWKNLLV